MSKFLLKGPHGKSREIRGVFRCSYRFRPQETLRLTNMAVENGSLEDDVPWNEELHFPSSPPYHRLHRSCGLMRGLLWPGFAMTRLRLRTGWNPHSNPVVDPGPTTHARSRPVHAAVRGFVETQEVVTQWLQATERSDTLRGSLVRCATRGGSDGGPKERRSAPKGSPKEEAQVVSRFLERTEFKLLKSSGDILLCKQKSIGFYQHTKSLQR